MSSRIAIGRRRPAKAERGKLPTPHNPRGIRQLPHHSDPSGFGPEPDLRDCLLPGSRFKSDAFHHCSWIEAAVYGFSWQDALRSISAIERQKTVTSERMENRQIQ